MRSKCVISTLIAAAGDRNRSIYFPAIRKYFPNEYVMTHIKSAYGESENESEPVANKQQVHNRSGALLLLQDNQERCAKRYGEIMHYESFYAEDPRKDAVKHRCGSDGKI